MGPSVPGPPFPQPQGPWAVHTGLGCRALTLDVQITSRRLMFIQLSQLTRCPLYVSPFLSSTSWKETDPKSAVAPREVSPYPSEATAQASFRYTLYSSRNTAPACSTQAPVASYRQHTGPGKHT